MPGNFPSVWSVRVAIDTYLKIAYDNVPLPRAVAATVQSINEAASTGFFQASVWETDQHQPAERLSLRLGNRFYPHMKLVLDRRPDGLGYVFRVDPHDQHILPPPTAWDISEFTELMETDGKLAREIEAEWEKLGLPTMASFFGLSPAFQRPQFLERAII